MPRSTPPTSIKLHLPSPTAPHPTASSSSTSKMPAYPLEVLLEAQSLARTRGEYFDIISYMSTEQRNVYLQKIFGTSLIPPPTTPTLHPHPVQTQPQTPHIIQPTPISTPPPESTPLEPGSQPQTEPQTKPEPIPEAEPLPPPIPPPTPQKIPDLSHLHWKQRQKRLAQIASGEIDLNSPLLLPPGSIPVVMAVQEVGGGTGGGSGIGGHKRVEVDRSAVAKSAIHWNSLLVQARNSRGPQWDYSTQTYQIDRSTPEHYTNMDKLTRDANTAKAQAEERSKREEEESRRLERQRAQREHNMGYAQGQGHNPNVPPSAALHYHQQQQQQAQHHQHHQPQPPPPHHQQQQQHPQQTYPPRQHQQQQQMYANPPAQNQNIHPNQPPPGFSNLTPQHLAQFQQMQFAASNAAGGGGFNQAMMLQAQAQRMQGQGGGGGGGGGGGVNLASLQGGGGGMGMGGMSGQGQGMGMGQGQGQGQQVQMTGGGGWEYKN